MANTFWNSKTTLSCTSLKLKCDFSTKLLTKANADGKFILTLEGAAYLVQLFQHGFLTHFDPDLARELNALPYLRLDQAATKQVLRHFQEQPNPETKHCIKQAADVLWHVIRGFHTEAVAQASSWLYGAEAEAKLTELFARGLRIEGEEVASYYSKAGGFTCFDTTTGKLDCRIVWTEDEDTAHSWLLGTICKQDLPQHKRA